METTSSKVNKAITVFYKDDIEGAGSFSLVVLNEILKNNKKDQAFFIPFTARDDKELDYLIKESIEAFHEIDESIKLEAKKNNTIFIFGFDVAEDTMEKLKEMTDNEIVHVVETTPQRPRTLPRVLFEDYLCDKVIEDDNVILYRQIQDLVMFIRLGESDLDLMAELKSVRTISNFRDYLMTILRQLNFTILTEVSKSEEFIEKTLNELKENIAFINMTMSSLSVEMLNRGVYSLSTVVEE